MSQITLEFSLTPPQEFAFSILQLFEEGSKVMVEASRHTDQIASPLSIAQKIVDASQTMRDIAQDWMSEPARLAEAQAELMQGYVNIWHNTAQCMMGQEPVVEPKTGDHRFKDPEWSSNPYFDYWKQMYLLTSNWAEDVLEKTNGLDDEEKHKARFALHQTTSALSPANFPLTNPEVMRTTLETKGQNLVKGMGNLLGDLKKSNGTLRISQTDTSAFEVGGNLAVTPGKIVYQNDIMQLIQYAPATEKVHRTPLLIVPPWINKFYILDLTQSKSFIRYIVDQGFTVFVVSWANPDEKMAGQTFENYMRDGILTAAQAVQRETGEGQCNVLGYCIGGTLLAATLAYLAGRDEKPFGSATFLTTQIDFTKAGDLKIFIDDLQLNALEAMMHQQGYLDGAQMAGVFNMLRPRDLIWPYVINNYMLGKKPFAFDILYWNQDSTRMAAANHQFYLRSFYMENKLARGEVSLGGVDLDMSRVTLPVYELATREDHIAPAQSVLKGAKLFGGPVEYVLAGSGHIAGVLNPPNKERIKYQYWTNPNGLKCDTIDHWLKTAAETPGSWWGHWAEWLAGYSGDKVAARTPGQVLEIIEDAPGTYVKVSF